MKVTAPAALTRETSIVVNGTAKPYATVRVGGATITADAAGNWSATVRLQEGPNLITATDETASDAVTRMTTKSRTGRGI